MEQLTKQGQEVVQRAILLTEETQRLAELTISLERSARQYVILDDSGFRVIFFRTLHEALVSLQLLAKNSRNLSPQDVDIWNKEGEVVADIISQHHLVDKATARSGQLRLYEAFSRLSKVNERIALVCKREIEQGNMASMNDFAYQRSLLSAVIIGSILLAMLLALILGVWLSRPLEKVRTTIERLGENKYGQPVVVNGPADVRRLGRQLDWLRERLAMLEDDKKRFLRHISHELKTPLAALREAVALLHEEVAGKLNAQQHEIVNILGKNTSSLQNQIEDLLRYNAAAFEAQHLQLTKISLFQLIEAVIQDQCLQWKAKDMTVEVRGDEAAEIVADAEKIRIVLANLLANAIKFSPPCGLVYFYVSTVAGTIKIDCVDQGPGVAEGDIPHIFDPFYQGVIQPPGARQSNGIGLSIVREYVAAHGGEIHYVPGADGAHFQLILNHGS